MKTCSYYKDLPKQLQDQVNQHWRQNEFNRKSIYYKKDTPESDLPYYFKTDYINNWNYSDYYLFSLCPICGLPEVFSDVIRESGYECKTVTTKCQCGNVYKYSA